MRTMLNPGSQLSNPAEYYLQWSGKVEKIKDTDGNINKEGGFLFWKDRDNDYSPVEIKLPFVCYPLGESMSITGGIYDPNGSSTFVSSNEFGDWNETITVYERETGSSSGTRIARGNWQDIKDTIKAHGGKLQTNLYVLAKINPDDKNPVIMRLQLKGGASFALSALRKKEGKNFYNQQLKVTGAEYKINGTVDYAVPVFEAGDPYDDDTIKGLQEYAAQINEYGQALAARNQESSDLPVIVDDGTDGQPSDETPTTEEVEKMLAEGEEINYNDLPF